MLWPFSYFSHFPMQFLVFFYTNHFWSVRFCLCFSWTSLHFDTISPVPRFHHVISHNLYCFKSKGGDRVARWIQPQKCIQQQKECNEISELFLFLRVKVCFNASSVALWMALKWLALVFESIAHICSDPSQMRQRKQRKLANLLDPTRYKTIKAEK